MLPNHDLDNYLSLLRCCATEIDASCFIPPNLMPHRFRIQKRNLITLYLITHKNNPHSAARYARSYRAVMWKQDWWTSYFT